jgi:hypothetical protein
MAKTGTGRDLLSSKKKDEIEEPGPIFGSDLPAIIVGQDKTTHDPFPNPDPPTPGPGPELTTPSIQIDETSPDNLAKKATGAPKISRAGGFNVSFEKIGINEKRAKYDKETRTIFINLEHPRIAMELKCAQSQIPVDDPNFQRMAYEIAFTEYAIVLAQELSTVQYFFDPQDALVELRQTLDELSKAFATVWRPNAA